MYLSTGLSSSATLPYLHNPSIHLSIHPILLVHVFDRPFPSRSSCHLQSALIDSSRRSVPHSHRPSCRQLLFPPSIVFCRHSHRLPPSSQLLPYFCHPFAIRFASLSERQRASLVVSLQLTVDIRVITYTSSTFQPQTCPSHWIPSQLVIHQTSLLDASLA